MAFVYQQIGETKGTYLSVNAGAGGDDAKDWAQMLLRMYTRYADRKHWKYSFLNDNTLEISAKGGPASGGKDGPYEFLKNESGVHRLVRISPYDAKKLRHTSFALVEVLPALPPVETSKIQLPESDVKVEFLRAGGPGGQNVNKVETAVRIVHIPTGLVVTCRVERSQSANRDRAMELLKIKLIELMKERHENSLENLRTKVAPEWGHEIRSYVLHPYKQVKNHATGKKISRIEEVLDGDLDLLSENL